MNNNILIKKDLDTPEIKKKIIQCNIKDIALRKYTENEKERRALSLKRKNAFYYLQNQQYIALNDALSKSIRQVEVLNEELKNAKSKAEESDNLKSAFLANISHEIRTPMNAIMGFSDFLLEPELPKEKLESFVQIINASCLQLMSIVNDIIDISKVESGQINIESDWINVNNLMNELYDIYKKVVEFKKLKLICICEYPNRIIQIKSDGNRIRQVLCNLLNNALKFTFEGQITFGYNIKENFIEFFVRDTGIGIASENHSLIFQRFRQVETSNNHKYEGNGLGLSISKAIIERLGGGFSLNSELNRGSSFAFTIPYYEETAIEEYPIPDKPTDEYDWDTKIILLVEDDESSHAYAEEVITLTKATILHAWNGEQAVECVKNHSNISLVLMDLKMPVMDGYEATRRIKQIHPGLPIVAQTAYVLSYDKKLAYDAGCDNYLAKPIDRNLFMQVLSRYLS